MGAPGECGLSRNTSVDLEPPQSSDSGGRSRGAPTGQGSPSRSRLLAGAWRPVPAPRLYSGMRQAWAEFLQGVPAGRHGVEIYADDRDLIESVARFLAAGLERREPAVVVATEEHTSAVRERLRGLGWNDDRIGGRLLARDARETLDLIMEGGMPSREKFTAVVGGLLRNVPGAAVGPSTRVFGEMVDLLCAGGDADAAFALEELWNDLAETIRFRLLCGYRLDPFDVACQTAMLPQVCRDHSHVMPARNYPRFARAVDDALREALGPTEAAEVYVLVSRQAGSEERVPLAQLILMWVTENMPRRAEEILSSARRSYGAGIPAR